MNRRKFLKNLTVGTVGLAVSSKVKLPHKKEDKFQSPCEDCPRKNWKPSECHLCSFEYEKNFIKDEHFKDFANFFNKSEKTS